MGLVVVWKGNWGVGDVDGSRTWADLSFGVQFGTPENGRRCHAEFSTEIGYDVLTPGPVLGFGFRF